jgi:hypothetical protein
MELCNQAAQASALLGASANDGLITALALHYIITIINHQLECVSNMSVVVARTWSATRALSVA